MRYDIITLGAGPAGLTAAIHAAKEGARVCILDKATRPGVKLLLAGGGKGNLTNRHVAPGDYVGENPAFAAPALERVPPETILTVLEKAGIPLEEREHGRIFCQRSARAVLDFLLGRLPRTVALQTGMAATGIRHLGGAFTVSCNDAAFHAPRCILATGGPAWPQCGADDSGLRLARLLGHRVVPPRPVLVPFVMPPDWPLAGLSGISLPARVTCDAPGSPGFTDSLLFTHKGLSGPAALQISCWWRKGSPLRIDFLPDRDVGRLLDAATGKATPGSVLARLLPERLLAALLDPAVTRRRIAELSRKQRTALADAVHRHAVTPLRTEGLTKAEAAAGGVDVAGVDPETMQSRLVPGLFFCGEVLDITGRLGGYNLHWAWASGTVAGVAAGAV
ncbi:MAG: aminoacetone oxidase family FAD-binding enzyme [Deltaproteobacteria bacterium]|nr:aminoacetone oxidase family FAD-binding enzyme [Deltaproteobacteria bacterium]